MTEQKYIIWSSDPDYEDWRDDLEEQYPRAFRAGTDGIDARAEQRLSR